MKPNLSSFLALMLLCAAAHATVVKVKSPDGKVGIVVTDDGGLSYSVFLNGREVVGKSRFGIIFDGVDLGADAKLGKTSSRRIREKYSMFGGHLLVQRSRKTRLEANVRIPDEEVQRKASRFCPCV